MAAPAPPAYHTAADGTGDDAHQLAIDAVPRVFTAEQWTQLEADLAQRIRALEAFVRDAFGPGEAFDAGIVPGDLLDRCPWFERRPLRPPPAG